MTEDSWSSPAVITGEAVEVELPRARLGTRAIALLIDVVAQVALFFVASVAMPFLLQGADPALASAFALALFVLVLVVWPVTFETMSRGRSPGKFAMGLRVVRDDGGPIRFRHALVRTGVGLAIEWPGLLVPLASWIFGMSIMLFSERGKRLGDLAAGTFVLQERLPNRSVYVPHMPLPLVSWAQTLDLSRLDDGLALSMRQFLSRSHELSPAARESIGRRLAAEAAAVTAPPVPPYTPGWAYLAAILAERWRRESVRLVDRRGMVAAAGLGWMTEGAGPAVAAARTLESAPYHRAASGFIAPA